MTKTTPSQQAKAAGLKSLRELSDISGVSTRTLENWHKHNNKRFYVVLCGALTVKSDATSYFKEVLAERESCAYLVESICIANIDGLSRVEQLRIYDLLQNVADRIRLRSIPQ